MRLSNVAFTGSINISGSLVLPNGTANLRPSNPQTGSLFVETSPSGSNLLVYNGQSGSGWEIAGIQTEPKLYTPPPSGDIEYLVIAGGGSGGGGAAGSGGAGGAGGYLSSSLSSVESGSSFTITIGAGSATAALNTKGGAGSDSTIAGSSISTITANGGGLGGYDSSNAGGDGGSGGGGSTNNGSFSTGGDGTVGQGNDGGDGASLTILQWAAGGGGGAGSAGETAEGNNNAGEGGSGLTSKISGTAVERAGGGGGGAWNSGYHGTATGGGGNGGGGSGNAGTAGTTNTGGGGGGGGQDGAGGTGGSGVAILGFPTASLSATGGVRTFFNNRVAHTFNSSGTFSVNGPVTHTHGTLDVFGDSSCLALYQLDGNANDRGGNYNGTATSVTYAQGYINDAGVFNGSSSIIALHSTAFKLTTYSFSGWIYSDDYNQSGVGIYDGGLEQPGNGTWYGLSVIVNSSKISSYGGDVAGVGGSGFYTGGSSNTTLSNGTWNHVVFVISGTSITGYINGSQDTGLSRTLGANIQYAGTSNTFHLGSRKGTFGTYGYFNGKIDQARIFNKALSASEITTLYNE